jgi:hypothetical protein
MPYSDGIYVLVSRFLVSWSDLYFYVSNSLENLCVLWLLFHSFTCPLFRTLLSHDFSRTI